ncbi:MAG TPA: sulfatase-like hydrolase/transferase [Bryobacteraceae bacterium]|nr:sulfatase-like hydrolase/transferase [Bryobacteraceae bacterium]
MFTIVGQRVFQLLILAACALVSASAQTPQTPVILISVDTLRADHLSGYGYRKLSTPHFDALAAGGTLYGQVQTQIPLTLPSHTCLFTSTYPFENGVEENAERVPAGVVTLASTLRAQGYKTAAFIGSSLLDRRFGLNVGFDFYDSPFEAGSDMLQNPYSLRVRRDGALVFRSATQWLNAHRGEKTFVFIHLFDLHTPYSRPATNGLSGYDTQIAYVDQLLGHFEQYLAANGWWDRSLVVLFADHGESLGDHGEASHGYFIYQSTLWVPLLIHWPKGDNVPARMDQAAGLIDVAPTILDLLHIPEPPSFEGQSLLKPGNHFVYAESVYARDAFQWAPLRGLRQGQMVYIDAPKPELYDLGTDPHELTNLIMKNPGEAATMKRRLDTLRKRYAADRPAPARDTSPQTLQQMRSLGYISGGRQEQAGNAPDPKDRLPEYRQFEKGLEALYAGHLSQAIATFQSLLASDRHNLPARGNLGDALLKAHREGEALRQWQIALHDDPSFSPADDAIGEYWLARGDYAKAKPSFEHIVQNSPGDYQAQYELGLVDRRLGLDREASAHLAAACRLLPDSAACAADEVHRISQPQ